MKNLSSTTSDCKDIGVRNSEFVAKTQFLYLKILICNLTFLNCTLKHPLIFKKADSQWTFIWSIVWKIFLFFHLKIGCLEIQKPGNSSAGKYKCREIQVPGIFIFFLINFDLQRLYRTFSEVFNDVYIS